MGKRTDRENGCAEITVEGSLPRSFGLTRREVAAAACAFAHSSSSRCGIPFRAVAVVLQDDAASDAAHRAIMDVPGATDVITQGYDPMPGEEPGVYGELYVNVERAILAAPRRRHWSAAKELLLYIAHGMDHLSGADDHAPADAARMRRRELAWLGRWWRSVKSREG